MFGFGVNGGSGCICSGGDAGCGGGGAFDVSSVGVDSGCDDGAAGIVMILVLLVPLVALGW